MSHNNTTYFYFGRPAPAISITPTISYTPSYTPSISLSPSFTPSVSIPPSISLSPTLTPSVTVTNTPSRTPPHTPCASRTPTPTPSLTFSVSVSVTPTPSVEPTLTPSPSITSTPEPSISFTPSQTPDTTITPSASITATATVPPTLTPSSTITPTPTLTPSITPTLSITPTACATPSPSVTPTSTITPTPSITFSVTPSVSLSITSSPTPTPTSSVPGVLALGNWEVVSVPNFSTQNDQMYNTLTISRFANDSAYQIVLYPAQQLQQGSNANSSIKSTASIDLTGSWSQVNGVGYNWWAGAAYAPDLGANGKYVAVPYLSGYNGSFNYMVSNDLAASWSILSSPVRNSWTDIIWSKDDNKFVALAGAGYTDTTGGGVKRVAVSSDGVTWTSVTTPSAANYGPDWWSLAYGNGTYVAVAKSYAPGPTDRLIMSSPDALNWTTRSMPVSGSLRSVAYGNGKFVVINDDLSIILTSSDGTTWTQQTSPNFGTQGTFFNLEYGGGIFCALACPSSETSSLTAMSVWSTDGISWNALSVPAPARQWGLLKGLAYGRTGSFTGFYALARYGRSWDGSAPYDANQTLLMRAPILNPLPEPSPTVTPSPTPTVTPSKTPTNSVPATITPSPTLSPTPTNTPQISLTLSITPSITPSATVTPSVTVTDTPPVTPSSTVTPTTSTSASPSPTPTPSRTPQSTPSLTPTLTPTPSITPSAIPPNPSDPSLQGWYSATDTTTINSGSPVNGDFVNKWSDKSAAGHDANSSGSTASRPKWLTGIQNGNAAMYFDGVNDVFTINPITQLRSLSGATLMWVGKTLSATVDQVVFQGVQTPSTPLSGFYFQMNNPNSLSAYTVAMAQGVEDTSVYTVNTDFHIHTLIFNGTLSPASSRIDLRIDGNSKAMTTLTNPGTATSSTIDALYIGTDINSNRDFSGYIGEILLYTTALTGTQLSNAEGYLAAKWGITLV